MPRPRKVRPNWGAIATIWQVSDELWAIVAQTLADLDPPKPRGRPRVDARATLNAIIFRLRSGCQWNQLPERFPDDSSVHRTFQRWVRLGVFERIWGTLVAACEELGGVDWEWQAADGALVCCAFCFCWWAQSQRDRADATALTGATTRSLPSPLSRERGEKSGPRGACATAPVSDAANCCNTSPAIQAWRSGARHCRAKVGPICSERSRP